MPGKRSQRRIKRPADLAVRYGGEEFTVLLPNTNGAGAITVAQEILEAIRALQIEHGDHPLGIVTASAGVTVSQPGTEDVTPAMLIKAADAFLYLAKNTGRNRWCSAGASQG